MGVVGIERSGVGAIVLDLKLCLELCRLHHPGIECDVVFWVLLPSDMELRAQRRRGAAHRYHDEGTSGWMRWGIVQWSGLMVE